MMNLPQHLDIPANERDLRAWLKLNRAHFQEDDYSPSEIAHFALMNGFDAALVYRVISHAQDALTGSYIENRASMQSWLFDRAMESFAKAQDPHSVDVLDLMPLWKELTKYQNGDV